MLNYLRKQGTRGPQQPLTQRSYTIPDIPDHQKAAQNGSGLS